MKIVATGGTGQLATALAETDPSITVVGRPEFDFDRPETLDALFADPPDALINAAAYTAVDRAESEPEAAARANALGPAHLARLCARHGTHLIHVSTDYVFDGCKGEPYAETDATNPQGVYGHTKRDGELAVLADNPGALIVRTSWVFAPTGRNFLRTMLAAAERAAPVRVVADQRGTPTAATDLAPVLIALAQALAGGAPGGFVHATGAGDTTWHGFAAAIFDAAAAHGCSRPGITPIATADWPTPARRPPDSRLATDRLRDVYNLALPPWEDATRRVVARLLGA